MIAEVYPLGRFPRKVRFFDYRCPPDVTVNAGDLVAITMRKTRMFAVVRKTKETSEYKRLTTITSIVYNKLYSEADIERMEHIADQLCIAPSQLFYFSIGDGTAFKPNRKLPTTFDLAEQPKSLSISKEDSIQIQTAAKESSAFVQLSTEGQFAFAALLARKYKRTLIICPNIRTAEEMHRYLPNASIIHGKTTQKPTKDAMLLWRERGGVLIGTKQASVLPTERLDAVVVLQATSDDYIFQLRNPRINPAISAQDLAKRHGAKLYLLDVSLPLNLIKTIPQTLPPATIIDQSDQLQLDHPLISEKALIVAKNTLQSGKKVLFLLNRKRTEGEQERATNTIGDYLQQALGERVQYYSSDRRTPLTARIQIVTEAFFTDHSLVERHGYGAVINVLADMSLDTDSDSTLHTYRELCKLSFFAHRQKSECLIQTFNPELFESFLDQETFIKQQREVRKRYHLPPYTVRIKIENCEDPNLVKTLLPEHIYPIIDGTTISFSAEHTEWKTIATTFTELPDSYTLSLTTHTYEP